MNNDVAPPSFELPTPQSVDGGSKSSTNEATQGSSELPHVSDPQSGVLPSLGSAPQDFTAQPVPQTMSASSSVQAVDPMQADEGDLIEKEWVEKAKQIIASTHDDPHAQNKEMTRMKADYLKKRYNKDLKVEET